MRPFRRGTSAYRSNWWRRPRSPLCPVQTGRFLPTFSSALSAGCSSSVANTMASSFCGENPAQGGAKCWEESVQGSRLVRLWENCPTGSLAAPRIRGSGSCGPCLSRLPSWLARPRCSPIDPMLLRLALVQSQPATVVQGQSSGRLMNFEVE
jgi:hypothetical protein